MSLLVLGAVACGGALLSLMVKARLRKTLPVRTGEGAEQPQKVACLTLTGFPIERGDVLVYAGQEDAWLPSVTAFFEQTQRGEHAEIALFFGPHAYVLALGEPTPALLRCTLVEMPRAGPDAPHVLEYEQSVYNRTKRLPLLARSECLTGHEPLLEGACVVAFYRSASGAELLMITAAGVQHVFAASRLATGSYERYPGRLTLD